MKFYSVFVTFVFFFVMESLSRELDKNLLQKVFVNISKMLSPRNQLVSIVFNNASVKAAPAVFAVTVGVPHIVKKFYNKVGSFDLHTSAIVLLDSIESLNKFNQHTVLPSTFSLSHQLIIYCQDGTFDKIKMIETSRRKTPII